MAGGNPEPANVPDLTAVFIYGRLRRLSRRQVANRLKELGGKLTRGALSATTIVLSSASAGDCLDALGRLNLPFPAVRGRVVSEGAFMRRIGSLADQPERGKGPYALEDVARLSGLSVEACLSLTTFDVLSSAGGFYAYQDLAAAKQAAQLVQQDVSMLSIIRAAGELGARGLRLSQVRLVEAPWGGIVQQIGGTMARLDGQLALVLGERTESAEKCFAEAERCDEGGDLDGAERWYSRAEQIDRTDAVIPFNRGNVLVGLSKVPEAMIAFHQALRRDSEFAEAAFNLAGLYEATGQAEEALRFYRQAIKAHPTYSQAIYNQARLLTQRDRFSDALPLWDRFIEVAPDDPDIGHARRLALLCRMEMGVR